MLSKLVRVRQILFAVIVLVPFVAPGASVMADDFVECGGMGNCDSCDSGSSCTLDTSNQEACNQWDGGGDSCDPKTPRTWCSTSAPEEPLRVVCTCNPCLGK